MDPWVSSLFGCRPRLPRECSCGDTNNETCTETGLRNHRHFPPFAYLPDENDVDESYYAPDGEAGFMYSPIRHWALVGEIADTTFFIRPRVKVQTRFGDDVLVNFHLEGANKPTFFNWTDLQNIERGSACLVILYPICRTFMDMNQGVRQENPDSAMVFPVGFEDLANEIDGYSDNNVCFHCGKPETSEHKLCRCTRCKRARYCDRDCQVPHWRKSHKKLCQHATKLFNLANLDFSTFHNYVDWNFIIKEPPSKEEREKRSRKALREFLYERGAPDPELSSMPRRLGALLSAIETKALETDPVTKEYQESSLIVRGIQREDQAAAAAFCGPVGGTFLIQSLRSLLEAVTENPDLRYQVADMRPPEGNGGFGVGKMSHFISEEVMESIFFALPIWQHEENIGQISWALESHGLFSRGRSLYENNLRVWNIVKQDNDVLIVKNRVSGTCFFAADNMELVSNIAEQMATDRPEQMLIRVLRVTANESWEDAIRSIAISPDVPDNVYTLWIREEVPMCGRFNPPRRGMSLVDQLLDREQVDYTEMLLRGLGVSPANIIRPTTRESASRKRSDHEEAEPDNVDLLECASCGNLKPKGNFSRNQRMTKGAAARCKECIRLSQSSWH